MSRLLFTVILHSVGLHIVMNVLNAHEQW